LAVQLGLKNLDLGDDLISMYPEIPEEEILREVFEEYGFVNETPEYTSWNGSLQGLVDIARDNMERFRNRRNEL
jgi:hypothetical protein